MSILVGGQDIITTVSNGEQVQHVFVSSRFVIPFRIDSVRLPITFKVSKPALIVPYITGNEIKKTVSDRLAYLDKVFDEEAHIEKYRAAKQILIDLFDALKVRKAPYIGIDDNGQLEAFWYDGDEYKVVSLVPVSEKKIIVSCLKDSNTVITVTTSLENLKKNHGQELSMPWKEILV